MPLHIGKTPSREGWLGFESDEHLTGTKARLKERCLPCMTGLYDALREGHDPIPLPYAWECWKISVVVKTLEECQEILLAFGEAYPGEKVQGKFGGGAGRDTVAVIFHTETEKRRDELAAMLGNVLDSLSPPRKVLLSRGCGNPFETLLGPWPEWRNPCPVAHPERAAEVKAALRDSLYRNG